MDLANSLRKLTDTKLKTCQQNEQEKYRLIKNILIDDDCFFEIEKTTAYAMLEDLGFKKEEIPQIYDNLINEEAYINTHKIYKVGE